MSLTNKLCAIVGFILTPIIYPSLRYIHKKTDREKVTLKYYFKVLKFGWSMDD